MNCVSLKVVLGIFIVYQVYLFISFEEYCQVVQLYVSLPLITLLYHAVVAIFALNFLFIYLIFRHFEGV